MGRESFMLFLPIFLLEILQGDRMAIDTQKQKQLKESMLQAIDTLINQAVSTREWDQTLLGTIDTCKSALTGEYIVTCNGGKISAFTRDGEEYKPNELVYISVPQGNFNNKKFILGKASTQDRDGNVTFVNSLLNSYNTIGRNLLANEENLWLNSKANGKGLNSFKVRDGGFVYYYVEDWERSDNSLQALISKIDELNSNNQMLTFNQDEFRNYTAAAEALLIEGTFQTRLNKAHRTSADGHYGLAYTLAFKNRNAAEKENWKDYTQSDIEYRTFVLDSSKMFGNPLQYEKAIDQSALFDFDKDNFLFLKSIEVYSEGFEESENITMMNLWGNDIFITMPEIHLLRTITATNGDYTLRLSTPQGATFKTNTTTEILTAQANVTYKTMDISDQTTYYWFLKDTRITAASDGYHIYGGAGWRYLKEKNTNYILTTSGYENKAYDNQYLVVGVYKQSVVLKQEFSLYNEANARDIIIESDLGNIFSFDRGEPILTCKIKDKDDVDFKEENFDSTGRYPDSYYSFYWAIMTADGTTTSFTESAEEIKEALSNIVLGESSFAEISSLRQQLSIVEQVQFSKGIHGNKMQYPVGKIANSLTVLCSVFRKESEHGTEYPIGNASLFLVNEDFATSDYSIMIVNGNQHFQYDEYGTAPTSEKNLNPQEVLPLSVRFFDPTGIEVNETTYSIRWKVPIGDSMINIPKDMKLSPNAANNYIEELYTAEIFPLQIADYFNYETISNSQVTAMITYEGKVYEQDSNLWFDKVGDNGTNGTDISVKVAFDRGNLNDKYMLAIKTTNMKNPTWNTGKQFAESPISLQVFQRGELLDNESTSWSIAGNSYTSKHYTIEDSSYPIISFINNTDDNIQNNLIIRGRERRYINSQSYEYYGFLGIPLVNVLDSRDRDVLFHKRYCLQEVTYNAAGQYPRYDKSAGLSIALRNAGRFIRVTVEGGRNNETSTANFSLYANKDGKIILDDGTTMKENPSKTLLSEAVYNTKTSLYEYMCYILPDDVYDGEWHDNVIHGKVYSSWANAQNDYDALVEFYYPIYMHLNTFGLKSLNAWDGNRIEINEDENYILAPQIGAGEKDDNNRFTGIVMGSAKDYNKTQKQDETAMLGLLGYSHGKQSIWLDAETGNATFGLPESLGDANNNYTEGQIKLVPGGESTIGRWTIGADFLSNIRDESGAKQPLSARNQDSLASNHKRDIGHMHHGVLLSAEPSYLSVKSRILTEEDLPRNANTVIDFDTEENNSFEIQIDPNQRSMFTILQHYKNKTNSKWYRRRLVYIDENGRFCSNALKDSSAGLTMGPVGAFGYTANQETALYLGAVVEVGKTDENDGEIRGNSSLFKIFTERNNGSPSASSTVYLSGGTNTRNEYQRNLSMHFKEVHMYAGTGISKNSDANIILTPSTTTLSQSGSTFTLSGGSAAIDAGFIYLNGGSTSISGSSTGIKTDSTSINSPSGISVNSGGSSYTVKAGYIEETSTGSFEATGTTGATVTGNGAKLSLNGTDISVKNSAGYGFFASSSEVKMSKSDSEYLKIGATNQLATAGQFSISAKGGTLELGPSRFYLNCGSVSLESSEHIGKMKNQSGVAISGTIQSNKACFGVDGNSGTKEAASLIANNIWVNQVDATADINTTGDVNAEGDITTKGAIISMKNQGIDDAKENSSIIGYNAYLQSIYSTGNIYNTGKLTSNDWIWSKNYISGPDFKFYKNEAYFSPVSEIKIDNDGSLVELLKKLYEAIPTESKVKEWAKEATIGNPGDSSSAITVYGARALAQEAKNAVDNKVNKADFNSHTHNLQGSVAHNGTTHSAENHSHGFVYSVPGSTQVPSTPL